MLIKITGSESTQNQTPPADKNHPTQKLDQGQELKGLVAEEQELTQPAETQEIANTEQNLADTQQASDQATAALAEAQRYAEEIGDEVSLQELKKILTDLQTAQLNLAGVSDAAKKLIEFILKQQKQPTDEAATGQDKTKKEIKEKTEGEKEEEERKKIKTAKVTGKSTEETTDETSRNERDEYEGDDIDIASDDESALQTKNLAAKKQAAAKKKAQDAVAKQAKKGKDATTEADRNLKELLDEPIDFTQESNGLIRKIRPVLKNPKTRTTAIKHITNKLKAVNQTKTWPSSTKASTGATGKLGGARTAAKLANNLKQIGDEIRDSGKPDNREARPFYKDAAIAMLTALKNCDKNLPEFGYDFRRYVEQKVYPLFLDHRQSGEETLTRQAIFNELINIRGRRSGEKQSAAIYKGSDQETLDTLQVLI